MPAPTVSVKAPPPLTIPDTILRPQALVAWTGGTGPFDVLHEWDTDNLFGTPISDLNAGATSEDTGTPPSDMGPAGTAWFYRVRVTDTDDSTFTVSAVFEFLFEDVQLERRYLWLLANVGVGFTPTDDPPGGWGPDPDPAGGGPDGNPQDFRRYLYLMGNVGFGFDPTDGTEWETLPPDGFTQDFRRHLYLLGNVTDDTPVPHIWYLFPTFGREGWEFKIVGYGFGDTQGEHTGTARLNALAVGIISWAGFAEVGLGMEIDPAIDLANPVHQEVAATVPTGGESGLVFVETDDV